MSFWRMLWTLVTAMVRHRRSMAQLRSALDHSALTNAVMEPYRRGDYQTALAQTESFKKVGESGEYCFYRGAILLELG
jgi:hypothetical protein